MQRQVETLLTPQQAWGSNLKSVFAKVLRVQGDEISGVRLLRRSIDARGHKVAVRVQAMVYLHEEAPPWPAIERHYPHVQNAARVVIIGAGPAGLFAALRLIERGLKPVVLERGKDVHKRKTDIALLNTSQRVNPDSNYCFGEGGAGTFSDGKLYTRSTKRGNVGNILETLVCHGAPEDILIDSHPHVGTDKLPRIVEALRETIRGHGGEVHFETRLSALEIQFGRLRAVIDQHGQKHEAEAFILATGHSARDVASLFAREKLPLEFKAFALGVRVEHPQELINNIQYHTKKKDPFLPAASYSLVHQAQGRGVFSFCMCPGGIIVPSATGPNELIVNGMSNSRRNSPFANSGIVVGVEAADLTGFQAHGALMGLKFQEHIEHLSFLAGGSCQRAPAQRLTDFLDNTLSESLPKTSYRPGLNAYPLNQVLPGFVASRLQEGFRAFNQKMPGFISQDAVLLATESRTSSPIRFPRNPKTLEYIGLDGIYPCGEGSGYAGGIVSSAIDGVNAADQVLR